jgi:hypothetical protein
MGGLTVEFKILDYKFDDVIQSVYITTMGDYDFALQFLVPLIDKLDFQRIPLRASFYKRLENDILNGCIMPPLTVAINSPVNLFNDITLENDALVREHLDNAFVLDGIQRLNTLKRISIDEKFNKNRPIYINVLVCDSMDRLLYRMITLNNGQKPMTARHQIEVLASNIFDFNNLPILSVSEKQSKANKTKNQENHMSKENLIKGYLAFISNSINIDNQKIIESKMDELITEQIMESNLVERDIQYKDVINYINLCLSIDDLKYNDLKNWFSISNNFIGFSAAMATSFNIIKKISLDDLCESIELFEHAFSAIDVSKIKLGLSRRRMVKHYFENYNTLSKLSENKLIDNISQEL